MQLYAFDQNKIPISACQAIKHQDYICLECSQCVRLRRGLYRRSHFYHIEPNRQCRLSKKTLFHIQTQLFIQQQFSPKECCLEYYFPVINRIADVAWITQKIVFEVQCSPMTAEELLARIRDYRSIGWDIVWILHDQRYNKRRLTSIEASLQRFNHYFTNIDKQGQGIIYDQYQLINQGERYNQSYPLPINLKKMIRLPLGNKSAQASYLKIVDKRLKEWTLDFEGSLVNINLYHANHPLIKMAQAKEEVEALKLKRKINQLKKWLYQKAVHSYQLFFHYLLEKVCK